MPELKAIGVCYRSYCSSAISPQPTRLCICADLRGSPARVYPALERRQLRALLPQDFDYCLARIFPTNRILRQRAAAQSPMAESKRRQTRFIGRGDLGSGLVGRLCKWTPIPGIVFRHHGGNDFPNLLGRAAPTVSASEIVRISCNSSKPTASTTSSTLQGSP